MVERELGRGGMGAVYAVVHEDIGKRAALKVVHSRLVGTSFNLDRMLLEARVVNQVGHPNIVDIFETGKLPDGRPYIVMERLEGKSLATCADEGRVEPELALVVLRQVCDALIAAHAAGVVHRDLKLDNVFLVDNPEDPSTPKVKLLDWGIAKIIHEDVRHTIEGQLVGTPQYLSPEQARGGQVTPKTDVYSLGVMAYELFLDQLPFEAETAAEIMTMHLRATPPAPSDLWPEIPSSLEDLLLEMLAKRPEQRPTVLEVVQRLEEVCVELEQGRASSQIAAQARPALISKPVAVPQVPMVPMVAIGSGRVSRRGSAEALAPTKVAHWRPRAHHWRYAIGGLAIAGCIAMLVASRGGDQVAAAATPGAGAAAAAHAHRDAAHALAAAALTPAALTPATAPATAPTEAPVPTPELTRLAAPAAPAAPVLVVETAAAPAPKVTRAHATRAAARAIRAGSAAAAQPAAAPASKSRAPASPRRGAKLDPDGTVDPYR
ncbi:MAG TPA: serine/threonine-protein kinase [Kofleriaceae bacterium]|nr:serine/threonine-protein kinase [Kofleriaceae bacterium]